MGHGLASPSSAVGRAPIAPIGTRISRLASDPSSSHPVGKSMEVRLLMTERVYRAQGFLSHPKRVLWRILKCGFVHPGAGGGCASTHGVQAQMGTHPSCPLKAGKLYGKKKCKKSKDKLPENLGVISVMGVILMWAKSSAILDPLPDILTYQREVFQNDGEILSPSLFV